MYLIQIVLQVLLIECCVRLSLTEPDGVLKLISENSYPSQLYKVTTGDGYILSLHRIPNPAGHPVLLFPGLMSTAADFVVNDPEKSLGFILYNLGYDVWLGNSRGTTFSRTHRYLDPDVDKEFWDFSWHEIGVQDLSASIDAILGITGYNSLQYIGHSQGCTALMVLLAERPEYNAKIVSGHLMAPAVYMGNTRSPVFRLFATFNPIIQDNIKNILQNYPGGTSAKQLDHFSQLVYSKNFAKFDYGVLKNWQKYGSKRPPEYSWSNIYCKMYIYYGTNDILVVPEDVETLAIKLAKNLIQVHNIPNQQFSHLDFLWAKDVDILVYRKLTQNLLQDF
ncbi:lipase 1-like [Ctenocephalides felis]|uniref:lipase 1-like n=1 Tax=Ctenocephalides felis TaxID=7515 RepID=UPI000E6E39AF|nr:lipase 1-like [Ctenocephalides felis]